MNTDFSLILAFYQHVNSTARAMVNFSINSLRSLQDNVGTSRASLRSVAVLYTRNKIFFRLPSCRTNVRKFSLRFQGPKIFNTINDEIKNSLNLKEFTSKLKSTFLD